MQLCSLANLFLLLHFYVSLAASQSCDSNAVCMKTDVGFNCTCSLGYEGSSTGCVNIDECESNTTCKNGETCTDTPGSYICHCGNNTSNICGINAMCKENSTTCVCDVGYTGDGYGCTDLNECTSDQPCHENATCNNTQGSYICACQSGFVGDGMNCTDVDECVTGEYNCSSPLICNNTIGGYQCICGRIGLCHSVADCIEIENSTSCVCNNGYTGDGTVCDDVDECVGPNECDLNANCVNDFGSYKCECKSGYTGDGFDCSGATFLVVSWMSLCIVLINVYKIIY